MAKKISKSSRRLSVHQCGDRLEPPDIFPMNSATAVAEFTIPVNSGRGMLRQFKIALSPLRDEQEVLMGLNSAFECLPKDAIEFLDVSDHDNASTVFDSYFNVARTREPSLDIFALSLVVACKNFHTDAACGNSLLPVEWGLLRAAFSEIADLLDGSSLKTKHNSVEGILSLIHI